MAPVGAKAILGLIDIMTSYTDFDRPFAAPPGAPADRLKMLRDAFEKMLADPSFRARANRAVKSPCYWLDLHHRRKFFTLQSMQSALTIWLGLFLLTIPSFLLGATMAEVTAKLAPLNGQQKRDFLVKGALAEAELMFYGTILVDEFTQLGKLFNARYPSLSLKHYFAPRQEVLNRSLTEAKAGRHAVDAIQVDSSYGYQFIQDNLAQPYLIPGRERFFDGTYDPAGAWYSMYHLTTALIYNTSQVKAEQAPQTYDDLLQPQWKGRLVFDPEAAYLLAAMEQAWGKQKAVEYLTRLSKQDLVFRRGGALTTQVVGTGEFAVGIAINGETSSAIRDKGSPLGFKLLTPKIVKPEGFFLMKNAPHPHAALLFAEWVLSEEAQSFLATTLGKGTAMNGVKSKYQEFQVQPDYVVTPKLGPKLNDYLKEFRQIMGIH